MALVDLLWTSNSAFSYHYFHILSLRTWRIFAVSLNKASILCRCCKHCVNYQWAFILMYSLLYCCQVKKLPVLQAWWVWAQLQISKDQHRPRLDEPRYLLRNKPRRSAENEADGAGPKGTDRPSIDGAESSPRLCCWLILKSVKKTTWQIWKRCSE